MQVIDTSVIYKWYVDEELSKKATEILVNFKEGKTEISMPELVFYEIANSLRFNPKNTEDDVVEVIDNLNSLNLNVVVITTGLLKDALKISYKYGITVYDGVFIALAKDLNFDFITADKKLYNKVLSLHFVKFLGNL